MRDSIDYELMNTNVIFIPQIYLGYSQMVSFYQLLLEETRTMSKQKNKHNHRK